MSVSSKIRLDQPEGFIRVEFDADLVFCADEDFEFIVSLFRILRKFVQERDQRCALTEAVKTES